MMTNDSRLKPQVLGRVRMRTSVEHPRERRSDMLGIGECFAAAGSDLSDATVQRESIRVCSHTMFYENWMVSRDFINSRSVSSR